MLQTIHCPSHHHWIIVTTTIGNTKSMGMKDCGLYAIAFATALAFGQNPSKLTFHQKSMQSHFVTCLEQESHSLSNID